MKKLVLIVMFIVLMSVAFAGPQRLTFDSVSNPVQLQRFLSDPLWPGDAYWDALYDLQWDASAYTLHFKDNAICAFGNTTAAPDVYWRWDGTDFDILGSTDGYDVNIGSASTSLNLYWYSDTSGDYVMFDEENVDIDIIDVDLGLDDDALLQLGTDDDITLQFDGTNLELFASAAGTPLALGGTTNGFDVTYYFETAGTIDIDFDSDNMTFSDDMDLVFGTDDDITIEYDEDGNDELLVTGAAGFANTVTFRGGQTRKTLFSPDDMTVDGTVGPTAAVYGTSEQSQMDVLQFDADGGSTGDDHAYIVWHVPDGYVTGSAALNIAYTFSTAEDEADEAQFDFTINAVALGEALDASGTALADQSTVISDASADNGNLHVTQYDIEQEDIAVDDMVVIKITVDESASALANSGTLDVVYCEIEYESTE